MIVSEAFAGDSMPVAWHQHDVYGEAVSLIARECQRKALKAAAILGVVPPSAAMMEGGVDHRTLQKAHDIVAAAWRFRENVAQTRFALDATAPLGMEDWLIWLGNEVATWDHEPSLVRLVIEILGNQNSKSGYRAENQLTLALLNRFRDVPWNKGIADLGGRLEAELS